MVLVLFGVLLLLLLFGEQLSEEQGWHSSESARLPPMWPGFDSGPVSHVG